MIQTIIASQQAMDTKEIKEKLEAMLMILEKDSAIIREGMNVVIKPNLVSARHPEEAATSHPAFIEAVIQICLERNCRITVAESPSGKMEANRMRMVYTRCGLIQLQEKYPVQFNLSDESAVVSLKRNRISVPVLKNFMEADLVINCCKMKSHGYTVFTGAVKNYFGVIPGLKKAELHARFAKREDFAAMIAELGSVISPQLNIMDAIVAMHKDGPTNGEVIHLGKILMSTNAFALDEAALQMIQMGKEKTPVQKAAIQMGLWNPDELVKIKMDEKADQLNQNFILPKHLKSLVSMLPVQSTIHRMFTPYPKIDPARCVGCMECFHDCPAKTIVMQNQRATIIKRKCLRCYCCQEVCNHDAVIIK